MHFQSGSLIRTRSSGSSSGGQPASLLGTESQPHWQIQTRGTTKITLFMCKFWASGTLMLQHTEEELTLRCWKPAGSCPWACRGWGLNTQTRRGRSGAPRRRRLCHLSNWRKSSGCSPPVSEQIGVKHKEPGAQMQEPAKAGGSVGVCERLGEQEANWEHHCFPVGSLFWLGEFEVRHWNKH